MAEQEETVRAVVAAVVDQQRVTAQLRRRDGIEIVRIEVVAVAGEQELEVEGGESSEASFVERLRVDLGDCPRLVEVVQHLECFPGQ